MVPSTGFPSQVTRPDTEEEAPHPDKETTTKRKAKLDKPKRMNMLHSR
jgi:hypothetical protein